MCAILPDWDNNNKGKKQTRFAGHCYRNKEKIASYLLLWQPNHGHTKIDRPNKPLSTSYHQEDLEWKTVTASEKEYNWSGLDAHFVISMPLFVVFINYLSIHKKYIALFENLYLGQTFYLKYAYAEASLFKIQIN